MTAFIRTTVKTAVISLQLILATTVLSVVYGFIRRGTFTLVYVFNTNFFVGAIITTIGVIRIFLPDFFKFDKLTDHTTLFQRYAEQREKKQEKAYEYLFLGMLVIVITGLVQLALAVLLPSN